MSVDLAEELEDLPAGKGEVARALTNAKQAVKKAEQLLVDAKGQAQLDKNCHKLKLKSARAEAKLASARQKAAEAQVKALVEENRDLRSQLRAEKARADEAEKITELAEPLFDLFKKETSYGSHLDAVIIGLLTDGSSAVQIQKFLELVAKHVIPGKVLKRLRPRTYLCFLLILNISVYLS